MGVSGSGKSTIGKLLSNALHVPFFDGDDYHPESNIEKMTKGIPLDDNDRKGWLQAINLLALKNYKTGAIIACSALKKSYRTILKKKIEEQTEFIYLKGTFNEISKRLIKRKGHFMPMDLLKSQFETLEEPKNAIIVSIGQPPLKMIAQIQEDLSKR